MRIALFSDIHGNTPGLRAVLAAIQRAGGVDQIFAVGDLIGSGPGTEEIFDLLIEHQVSMLRGNWEEIALWPQQVIPLNVPPRLQDFSFRSADWLQSHLGQPYRDLIASLPISIEINAAPGHTAFICHAAPGNTWSRTCSSEVSRATLEEIYGGINAEVVAYGHFHGHHTLWLDDKLLINVSQVGHRKDGLADFTLLSFTDYWQVRQLSVPYDLEEQTRLTALRQPPDLD